MESVGRSVELSGTPLLSSPSCSSPLAVPGSFNNSLSTAFCVGKGYYRVSTKAYNMTHYVVESLRLDKMVIATAMTYWHTFVSKHGLKKVDEIVLSASCVFLASKVEHYKVRIKQIVALVFEVNENSDEAEGWCRMLFETELFVCHTIDFNFQVTHPIRRIMELVPPSDARVLECAHRLFLLSYTAPLCTKASAEEVADTLVYLAADGAGRLDVYMDRLTSIAPERRGGIMGLMIEALAVLRKSTGLPKIDEMITARRKRLREQDSSRPSVACSSGSLDATPLAPTVD